MKPLIQLKTGLLIIMVLAFMLLRVQPSLDAQAQGRPQPTPTRNPAEPTEQAKPKNEKHRSLGTASSNEIGASVSGIVFNYSTSAPQGGIAVVIQGVGGQVETVTDEQGRYQFGNLGDGQARLNLRLAAEAVPVTANWPIMLRRNSNQVVNLGYHTGNPIMPVTWSTAWQGDLLVVQAENHLNKTVTNGYLDISLPSGLEASPAIQATQGEVQYGIGRVRIALGDLITGRSVKVQIPVKRVGIKEHGEDTQGQIIFTYDQQPTPQLIELAITKTLATATAASFEPSLIPLAGYSLNNQAGEFKIFATILLAVGLLFMGWWSLKKRNIN